MLLREFARHHGCKVLITEDQASTLPAVVELGLHVEGKESLKIVYQALHNAEKLTDPKPRELRDLNWLRSMVVIHWVSNHLWLMSPNNICDWFNRKWRIIRSQGITRQTINRMVEELSLKKAARCMVTLNKNNHPVFDFAK